VRGLGVGQEAKKGALAACRCGEQRALNAAIEVTQRIVAPAAYLPLVWNSVSGSAFTAADNQYP
jgi:hypothetical protein